jgi:osmotically-inducible protein OsmY
MTYIKSYAVVLMLLLGIACSTNQRAYKDDVKNSLEQADLKGLTVSEDRDKNTITLTGKLHSEETKAQASNVAKAAAGPRIIANEISVEPLGSESEAKTVESNQDSAIEKNYKAALAQKRLDKQSIRYNAKNGVLMLKGTVDTPKQRDEAQQLASSIPNVQQVVNEIQVKHPQVSQNRANP